MTSVPIAVTAATPAASENTAEPARGQLRDAAQQFEAILLRQVLASARNTNFGGGDLFGQSDQTFREMRDSRFADITSKSGQLGFATAIERQLAHNLPKDPS